MGIFLVSVFSIFDNVHNHQLGGDTFVVHFHPREGNGTILHRHGEGSSIVFKVTWDRRLRWLVSYILLYMYM